MLASAGGRRRADRGGCRHPRRSVFAADVLQWPGSHVAPVV